MRPDIYTKAVLTVIALLLATLVLKPFANPESVAYAQGPFSGVQFAIDGGTYDFFDARSGDLWHYNDLNKTWRYTGRVTAFGQPLKTK